MRENNWATRINTSFCLLMSDFDEIRDARTLEQLTEARDVFFDHWQDSHPALCDYLDENLSAEHLWVSVYINRHPHMGTKVTSRAEGAHSTLKNWLHSRHGSLFNVLPLSPRLEP
ncbi:hypothetical protein CF319_g9157 [Tilletia indica]|nr:hypothetical protein CF319_g9157 [Tilletia indica]